MLKFAHYTGAVPIAGRYTPGMFTNQIQAKFREPRLLIVSDPRYDHQVCHCVCTCWEGEEGGGGYTFYHCVCVYKWEGGHFFYSFSPRGRRVSVTDTCTCTYPSRTFFLPLIFSFLHTHTLHSQYVRPPMWIFLWLHSVIPIHLFDTLTLPSPATTR